MAINPLQAPINYMAMAPQENLGQQFSEFGQVLAERQKRQQAQEVKLQFSNDLQTAQKDGTQQAWLGMIAKYPQFREAFGDVRKGMGEERLKNEFTQGFEISNAMEEKNLPAAIERTQNLIAAKKNSGEPTKIYEDVLSALERGDLAAAQSGANLSLAVLDPDRYEKSVKARTTATKAPSELMESQAKAQEAVQKAANALLTAEDDIAKARAERLLKEAEANAKAVEARYADQTAKNKLLEQAAVLGLTKAQTGAALAQTRKLSAEASQAVLKLEALKATGGTDPAANFEAEEKLRKEFQTRTKTYQEVNQTYQTLKASSNAKSGPGDIALITGFMKMLDPGSVVRETEFATARDTAGLYTRLENILQKVNNGEFLKPAQRDEFVNLAGEYYKAAQKKSDEDKKAIGAVVKNYKLNRENVFGPEDVGGGAGRGSVNPPRPPQASAPQPPQQPTQLNVTVDY